MHYSRSSRRPRPFLLLSICLGLILYFSYHAVHGSHGLQNRETLTKRVHDLETELASLKAERLRLERNVALMTTKLSTHTDMLEEQARGLLNFAHPADIVMVRAKPEAPK